MKRVLPIILVLILLLTACSVKQPADDPGPQESKQTIEQIDPSDPDAGTETPGTDAPDTDAPDTDAPDTDAPETDAPETDAPETDAPETEDHTVTVEEDPDEVPGTAEEDPSGKTDEPYHLYIPTDYKQIFSKLESRSYSYWKNGNRDMPGGVVADGIDEEVDYAMPEEAPEPTYAVNEAEAADSGDYSRTNTQVDSIDEGDIVKTDGRYIYVLKDYQELIILSAAGAESEILSRTAVADDYDDKENVYYDNGDYRFNYVYENAVEMFVENGILAVILNRDEYYETQVDSLYHYEDNNYVKVKFYDVSDPAAPVLTDSFGQDGRYVTGRLMNGELYIVTNHYVYLWDVSSAEAYDEYIPKLYENDVATLMPLGRIVYPAEVEDSSYTVLCRYSMGTPSLEAEKAILGAGQDIYMSENYLYLYKTEYFEEDFDEITESVYRVTGHRSGNRTHIYKIAVKNEITVVAYGTVDGTLLNQFSLDEYKGKLRVVTTQWAQTYYVYEDPEYGFVNYRYDQSNQVNALTIFDEDLNVIGSVGDLAQDERVYSVRFSGDVGYFVTFRQVDPLFSVDLSDPYNPVVMGALKIPGFSNYLHKYTDTLLFGLGQNADPETGRTDGMKLSMFDVSDPFNVFERDKISVDSYYSTGFYNHKAILVEPGRALIGFPVNDGYMVYTYDEETGFHILSELELDYWWSDDSRGLYVGDCFYIVSSESMFVFDLEDFEMIAVVDYGDGYQYEDWDEVIVED